MIEYSPLFESRSKAITYYAGIEEKSRLAIFDWRRVFNRPIAELNSVIDTALLGIGVELQSCWEEIACVKEGRVRTIGINWRVGGNGREIRVSDARSKDENTRLEIRIMYPNRSGSEITFGWEVYTLSLDFKASERIFYYNDGREVEMEVMDVLRKPVLDLQLSVEPSKRLGFGSKIGDYVIKNPMLAKKLFIQGVRQVCDALKEPGMVLIP